LIINNRELFDSTAMNASHVTSAVYVLYAAKLSKGREADLSSETGLSFV
jgi:hypothetical protein